jgi:hypothetical protein
LKVVSIGLNRKENAPNSGTQTKEGEKVLNEDEIDLGTPRFGKYLSL